MSKAMQKFEFSEDEWQQINSALLVSIGVSSAHAREVVQQLIDASVLMDEIANRDELGPQP